HTFHSLGLEILREHPGAAGLQRGFRVAGEAERGALLAETLGLTAHKAERLLRAISKEKRTQSWAGTDAAEALAEEPSSGRVSGERTSEELPRWPLASLASAAMAAYGRALALRDWIDFDDLIALSVRALTADPNLAALYRSR